MNLDTSKISELIQLMGEDFGLLVHSYIDDNTLLLEELRENIDNYSEADIRKAHSIKSTSLNMGARAAAEQARQLEEQLKGGQALREADWLNLSQIFRQTVTELQEMLS